MIERLPYYYQKSQVTKDFYSVIQNILDKMAAGISTEDLRLFITTTDSFSLHERDVGLSETASDSETKRARVIARLQGNNLLTVEELKRLVRLYTNADCTVAEDYPHYTIVILFSEYKGVPTNIDEIKAAIEEVKPAHLAFEYEYKPNTWGECRDKLHTWGNCKMYSWYGAIYFYDGKV